MKDFAETAAQICAVMGWTENLLEYGIVTDDKEHLYVPENTYLPFSPLRYLNIWDKSFVQEIRPGVFSPLHSDGYTCYHCGDRIEIAIDTNRKVFILASVDKCRMPDPRYSVEIDFPTGKVVIGDWLDGFRTKSLETCLSRHDNILDHDAYGTRPRHPDNKSINYMIGKRYASEFMAELGILYLFVGNTCPSVYIKDSTIQIGRDLNYQYNDDTGEETETVFPQYEGFTELCGVCTDLWWVTAMDYDAYIEFIKTHNPDGLESLSSNPYTDDHIIEIPPGRYRFTSNYPIDGDDNPVYIHGERIGDVV